MEFFLSNNLTDDQWQKYFELNQELALRYIPDRHDPENSIEKFRKTVQARRVVDNTYNDYCLFDAGNAVGWLDYSTWGGKEFYCGFDALYDEIPGHVLTAFLSKINELLKTTGYIEAIYPTLREGIINSFKNINTPVYEEILISRLDRANMDESFYKNIAANSELNSWKLMYCSEIPESIMDNFIESENKCYNDLVSLNPYGVKNVSLTAKLWKEGVEAQHRNGTTFGFNILFDKEDKIAGICYICFDSSRKTTLRHNGGLTAVIPKYRGKGIGRFLKAKLYLKLLEENKEFEYITTDTMPWNTYMYKINEELGFKPLRKGCSFKFTNEFLNNYLNK